MAVLKYREQIYAGILGKIIGVYMGRPVEGWSYEDIQKKFGQIDYYVAEKTGAPFIVPDDDISGTFVFYRALEDNDYPADIKAGQIGEAWLNYIIEDKTILWWGGLSRSTEHSAYLRLKQGIRPPYSGAGEKNGMIIAEQIGSQIFIDTWAMVNPGNPERAARMAREAAVVSHDGIAVECAVYLAAMEAMAFEEKNIDSLIQTCRKYIADNKYGRELNKLLDDVLEQCERAQDWREVRQWIQDHHDYERYMGGCPMVTNHLAVIMALKMGGDDFRKCISIAVSAGWDTDCNGGNVGCLTAIRLGLDCIDQQADFRNPVADRMFVVSSDGGDVVSDAVREARKVLAAAAALNGEEIANPGEKYAFEYPGSVQGFMAHDKSVFDQAVRNISNTIEIDGTPGLAVDYTGLSGSVRATVSVQTYVDPAPKAAPDTSYFEVYASPAIYSGQTVRTVIECNNDKNPDFRFFISHYDENDEISTWKAEEIHRLENGKNEFTWKVPDTKGRAIYKLGFEFLSDTRCDGRVIIRTVDWKGAPEHFHMGLADELTPGISPFVTRTKWMMSFMNSTKHTGPDFKATFSISHPEDNGVMSIGTDDWFDYSAASTIQFVHAKWAGLIARSKGHRRYYAAVIGGGKASIIMRMADEVKVLAETDFNYIPGHWYDFQFTVKGETLTMMIDRTEIVTCEDSTYSCGAAGYVVYEGAFVAKYFTIEQK